MGGMITFHDYQCGEGTVTETMSKGSAKTVRSIKCPCCGKRAAMYFGGFNSMSRWNFSSNERGYNLSQPDPQTGEIYESYNHKMQVYAEHGIEEVGPVRGASTDYGVDPDPVARNPDVLGADSLEDIGTLLDKDAIDRGHTGGNDPTKFTDDEDSPGF